MLKNSIQQANNKETDVKKAAVAAFFLYRQNLDVQCLFFDLLQHITQHGQHLIEFFFRHVQRRHETQQIRAR